MQQQTQRPPLYSKSYYTPLHIYFTPLGHSILCTQEAQRAAADAAAAAGEAAKAALKAERAAAAVEAALKMERPWKPR